MSFSILEKKEISKNYLILFSFLILLIHQLIFQSYLFSETFHYDWQNVFSRLIFGKIWFFKNGLEVPWFTPHICCGTPFFANPESEYYSLSQLLFILFKPLTSIKILFFIYSIISFFGFFLVLNKIFKLTINASLIGSTIFLFNHYFVFHYLSGHLAWAIISFVPILFYVIFKAYKNKDDLKKMLFYVFAGSLMFALMMHSGGSRIIVEIFLSIYFILLIYLIIFKDFKIIVYTSISLFIGLLISSSKIYSAWVFTENVSREMIPMYFYNVKEFFYFFLNSFFFSSPTEHKDIIKTTMVSFAPEEMKFNISIVPIIILIFFFKNFKKFTIDKIQIRYSLFLLISIFIIILLNFSNTQLGQLVQKLPIITSDWITIRLLGPLIFVFTIFSSIMFDKINFSRNNFVMILFITVIIVQNISHDRAKFDDVFIHKHTNLKNHNVLRKNIDQYNIDKIMSILGPNFEFSGPKQHEFFLENKSIQFCYYTIFGYYLERLLLIGADLKFDKKIIYEIKPDSIDKTQYEIMNVLEGDPFIEKEGSLNFINPSCFINPTENDCEKNYLFKKENRDNLVKFLNYQSFGFKQLSSQVLFNYISIVMFMFCMIYFCYWMIFLLYSKMKKKIY